MVGTAHRIVCDWLDSSHVTFASLHSKILYVDCLPANYRDNAEFRKIFSVENNPCYCMVSENNNILFTTTALISFDRMNNVIRRTRISCFISAD